MCIVDSIVVKVIGIFVYGLCLEEGVNVLLCLVFFLCVIDFGLVDNVYVYVV